MAFSLFPWARQVILDAVDEWAKSLEPTTLAEAARCGFDRQCADEFDELEARAFEVVDLEAAANAATYANGKRKRDRYPRVNLARRRVVIVLHQTGVERGENRWRERGHLVTCHRLIGPSGTRYKVHPLDVRLVAANRVDRDPWHAISIEVCGNFEGLDGSGRWYKPDLFGRGRMGEAQLRSLREAIVEIVREVSAMGGEVFAIIPHRTTGHDSKGRPNRQICPGSRVWSQAGEWAGAHLGLRVPAPTWRLGGDVVPIEWQGPYNERCSLLLAA